VIRRSIEAPRTFDADGWLTVGLCGHQPSIGESYISTGSLYLCSAGLLPLGLPREDAFWSGAPKKWTSQKVFGGEDVPADHAISSPLVREDLAHGDSFAMLEDCQALSDACYSEAGEVSRKIIAVRTRVGFEREGRGSE
jgi:hypothetical protein